MSTCSICLEGFRTPRELPCHHPFCETCLQEFIDNLVKDGKVTTTFDCPNCRTPTLPPKSGSPMAEWARQFPCFPKQAQTKDVKVAPIIKRECNPCLFDGRHNDAKKYCTTCREYLCEECHSFHRRMALLRNHKVIDADEIGKLSGGLPKELCSCEWNKKLKYYCPSHQIFCCSNCKTDKHQKCANIQSIADLSLDLRQRGKIETVLGKLDWIRDDLAEIAKLMDKNKLSLESERSKVIETVRKMHEDLKVLLEQLEVTTLEKITATFAKASSDIIHHKERCRAATEEVETTTAMMKSVQGEVENQQVYVAFLRLQGDIVHYEKGLENIVSDTKTFELTFEPDPSLQSMTETLHTFGDVKSLERTNAFIRLKPILWNKTPINLKTFNPPRIRTIINLVTLPSGNIALVHSYQYVELFDCNAKSLARYEIDTAWDIAVMKKDEIAVTSSIQKKIYVLSTDNGFDVLKTISTERRCYGITYCSSTTELIITTHSPNSVQILSLTGDVVKTIEKDNDGKELFSDGANRVTVNDTGDMLYVSDCQNGVIGVHRNGCVKFVYEDVNCPCGISTDGDGNVYVCGNNSNNVVQILPDGSCARVLLSSADGIKKPSGLFFNKSNDSFMVCNNSGSKIAKYQMQ